MNPPASLPKAKSPARFRAMLRLPAIDTPVDSGETSIEPSPRVDLLPEREKEGGDDVNRFLVDSPKLKARFGRQPVVRSLYESKQRLIKYRKVFTHVKSVEKSKAIFLAKFQPKADDDLSVALLAAADWHAAAMVCVCNMVPSTLIIILIAAAFEDSANLSGYDFWESATPAETITAVGAIGALIIVNAYAPIYKMVAFLHKLRVMRTRLPKESTMIARLRVASFTLAMTNFSTIFVLVGAISVAIVSSARLVVLLFLSSLFWVTKLHLILVQEMIYRYYRHATVTMAITDLIWPDHDSKHQFWVQSSTSKDEIRSGLVSLETPTDIKWMLLTDPYMGLGLGSSLRFGVAHHYNMEVLCVNWDHMDEESVAELGVVASKAVQTQEWRYYMSNDQRRWFFKLYPVKASEMPFTGSVNLSCGNYSVAHTASCARIIANPNNEIDELFANNSDITDEGGAVIAEALKSNGQVIKLWIHSNSLGAIAGRELARSLLVTLTLTPVPNPNSRT
uniref:Uncharacterized protein n=1 Tax=Lotharella globosa TaxID=91324 RepID=A0A7S3Z4Q0_9EUKA